MLSFVGTACASSRLLVVTGTCKSRNWSSHKLAPGMRLATRSTATLKPRSPVPLKLSTRKLLNTLWSSEMILQASSFLHRRLAADRASSRLVSPVMVILVSRPVVPRLEFMRLSTFSRCDPLSPLSMRRRRWNLRMALDECPGMLISKSLPQHLASPAWIMSRIVDFFAVCATSIRIPALSSQTTFVTLAIHTY